MGEGPPHQRRPQLVRGVEAAGADGRAVTDTCPTWPTLLAWIENDLPDEESLLINTHVADCDECRERLALMKAVGKVVKGSSPPSLRQVARFASIF